MTHTSLRWLLPLLVAGSAFAAPQDQPEWWNNFRGPDGNCVSRTGNPPVEWSEQKNIKWKVTVPGLGCSSPIIWGDRVYVTTAVETDREGKAEAPAEPPRRPGRRGRGSPPPTKIHEFVVMAFDRADGKVAWQTKVNECVPHEGHHGTASFASASPVTDGERIYAFFGSRGLHCLDMEGNVLWSKDYGLQRMKNRFGEGASCTLYEDTLIVPWDHEGDSFLAVLDKKSGKERWRIDRKMSTTWATPVVVKVGNKEQIVIAATESSHAYDYKTGKLIWQLSGMTNYCVPTPPHADGLIYLMSGYSGAALQAVRLKGAKGDLEGSKSVVWEHNKSTAYTPSALLYDGMIYFCRVNSAIFSCLDAKTGEIHYTDERLIGLRSVYASPVGAAGRVYITSREGVTTVLAAGKEPTVLATNKLDDRIDGTAAIVGNELYLRGATTLYCIAEK